MTWGAVGVVAATGATAVACLPDLDSPPPPPPPVPGASYCGDGIINLEAGEQCDPGDAGLPGCTSACQVSCEGGIVDPASNHCYFTVDPPQNFFSAQGDCTYGAGHVIPLGSEPEFSLVQTWHADAGYWIGLTREAPAWAPVAPNLDLEPGWAPGCAGCFGRFAADSGTAVCLTAVPGSALWLSAGCPSPPRDVVCEREPPGNLLHYCPGASCFDLKVTFGQKHYVYIDQASPPDDAKNLCNALQGSLVAISSPEEREQLWRALGGLPVAPTSFWIGLSRSDAGAWTWDDGSDAGLPWAIGEPIANGSGQAYLLRLGSVDSQLAQNDAAAGDAITMPFVCQIPDVALDGGP